MMAKSAKIALGLGIFVLLAGQAEAQQYNYRYNGLAPGVPAVPVPGYGQPGFVDPYPTLDHPPPGWRGQPPQQAFQPAYPSAYEVTPPKFIPLPRPRPQLASLAPQIEVEPQDAAEDDMNTASVSAAPKLTTNNAHRPGVPYSCQQGEQVVAGLGFGDIQATDCEARIMRYKAEREGKNYEIRVSAMNGEVTEVRMLP